MKNHRLVREKDTISKMISLYCRKIHSPGADVLCPDCRALEEYALERITRCPYGESKPTCAQCTIHCYSDEKRAEIRQVMRFSGPRMLPRHPLLAILHLVDGFRFRRE